MSIAGALNNAVSGLTAASRMAETVSANTANAMTEGYARRQLSLSSETLGGDGGGVRIMGVVRVVNETLLQDKRLADAAAANTAAKTAFYADLETRIGDPDTSGSLGSVLSAFESSLITAASMPDSTARLTAAVTAAQTVSEKLNSLSTDLQQARLSADKSIAKQVKTLNETLAAIEVINRNITTQVSIGRDASGLMDERQRMVDQISEIVPIRVVQRDNNQIALFSKGGAILLDGTAAQIGFNGAGAMAADMTLVSGNLSGLTVNDRPVSSSENGAFGGGTLGAAFAIRDSLAPQAQAKLDAVARDLMTRFQDPAVDPTLAAGDPGLFTDLGNALNIADEVGLAGRLRLNTSLDPTQGGAVWHLRDGLGALTEGAVGDASLLNALSDALSLERAPGSGDYGAALRSASGLAADFLSFASASRQSAELGEGYAVARKEALTEMTLADGVDTDYEMQTLLVVEKAYAANARVIQTIDALLQELLDL